MIYLDASALVKLIFDEPESAALERWLGERTALPKISSELSIVEVLRVCRRYDEDAVAEGRRLVGGLDLLPMTGSLVEEAATVGPRALRSLDALHLASALSIRDGLVAFVTYDDRLGTAAEAEGLEVTAPS